MYNMLYVRLSSIWFVGEERERKGYDSIIKVERERERVCSLIVEI